MPNIYGDALIKKIKAVNPAVFSVICTGYPSMVSALKLKEEGVHGLIVKPFNSQVIIEKIQPFMSILEDWAATLITQGS